MTEIELVDNIWGEVVLRGIPKVTKEDVERWVRFILMNKPK